MIRHTLPARQGCELAPKIFNARGEEITENEEDLGGVRAGEQNINNLRFVDDAALISDSQQKLQELVNQVIREDEKNGLRLNIDKTFSIVNLLSPHVHIRGQMCFKICLFVSQSSFLEPYVHN